MVCFSPVRFDIQLTFRALDLRRGRETRRFREGLFVRRMQNGVWERLFEEKDGC